MESGSRSRAKRIKLILEIGFLAALMAFAIIYILKDDPIKTFSMLGQAEILPLLLAILLIIMTLVLDGMNITLLSRLYNRKYHYYQGLMNVCVGQVAGVFVKSAANIIQAYTFSKQDIKNAQAASILTMNYLMFQISLLIYSFVMVILGYPLMKEVPIELLGNMPLSLLSILVLVIQSLILFGICLLGFSRRMHRLVLNGGIDFLVKLHLCRNPEKTRRKLTLQFVTYRIEMKRLFTNLKLVFLLLLSNLLKRFLLDCVPFLVFLSLGIDGGVLSFSKSLFATGYISTISSLFNVGIPEIMFQSTFSFFLGGESFLSLASAANLLWRSITFYLLFAIGLLSLLLYRGSPRKYQLLYNTATIYDLEIDNIRNADESTKSYIRDVCKEDERIYAPLLNQEEVSRSFQKLRKNIASDKKEETETIDDDLQKALQEQQLSLAKAQKEVADILSSQKPDREIQKETDRELRLQEKRQKKISERRARRIEEKRQRKYQKILHRTTIDNEEGKNS